MESSRCIGVDIGGTKIAAGVVRFPAGEVEAQASIPTQPERGGGAVLADIESMVAKLSAEAAGPVSGVGVGVCELVSTDGEIMTHGCIKISSESMRSALRRFGAVAIEADVRAAALAEAFFGAGQGKSVFLYVTIGTGISSCLVIDGRPFAGACGAAGTLASGILPVNGPTLEEIASGPALAATYGSGSSPREILAAAEQGNARAVETVRWGGASLGAAIGWLVNVLDPELVILGGGLGLQSGIYREALVSAARGHLWWPKHREVNFVSAGTGVNAGVIGAAIRCSVR